MPPLVSDLMTNFPFRFGSFFDNCTPYGEMWISGSDSTSLSIYEVFSKILNYELSDLGENPPVPASLYRPKDDRTFDGYLFILLSKSYLGVAADV